MSASIVFGASSGIGLATAQALAAEGGSLMLVAREASSLERAAQSCRSLGAVDVRTIAADVTVAAEVEHVLAEAVADLGRVDLVVHTAAVMGYGTVEEMPAEVFTGVVDTAVHGTLHVARAALPVLRRQGGGTLVIVNSLLGSVTVPNMGAYATSKWAQRALARTLQQELRDVPGVHCCLVSPGSINTPIYDQAANVMGRGARPPVPVLQPEVVGRAILRLRTHPRRNVSVPVGPGNPVIIAGYRLVPQLFDLMVGPLFRLGALTRQVVAPTVGNVASATPEGDALHGRWPED